MDPRALMRSSVALGALACCVLVTSAALALPAASAAQPSVSANWAGYVATRAGAGKGFSSVSGAWRAPTATCASGRETDAAVWVGLGGYSETSRGLEQVGTDADCTSSGTPVYSSWFELLPAEPVNLKLAVHPGDAIVASVTVHHQDVTLRIRDLTTGERFSTTRRSANIDASSADWIVEAPSVCPSSQTCDVLSLTDFGQVSFASATAVSNGHTGAIDDPAWSQTELELQQQTFNAAHGRAGARVVPTKTLTVAAPTPSTAADGAFSVSWQQQALQLERSSPTTLPGFGGGSP
jgi:hypothetical protein